MKQKIKVWDAPTRLFHWLLVLLMGFMWYSATRGGDMLVWHLRGGLLMLALVVFRLCWGIWGSDTAKFSRFVRPFSEIRRYTQGQMSENELVGHNPLGALMVIALLAALVFRRPQAYLPPMKIRLPIPVFESFGQRTRRYAGAKNPCQFL